MNRVKGWIAVTREDKIAEAGRRDLVYNLAGHSKAMLSHEVKFKEGSH
jgi:hypothetical protein